MLILALNAVVVVAKVSYDGAKALRIPVGEDVTPLMDVIRKLSLPVWKGAANGVPVPNSHVDLVVPAREVEEFNKLTADMDIEVMYDDLGLAIAAEGAVVSSAGSSKYTYRPARYQLLTVLFSCCSEYLMVQFIPSLRGPSAVPERLAGLISFQL